MSLEVAKRAMYKRMFPRGNETEVRESRIPNAGNGLFPLAPFETGDAIAMLTCTTLDFRGQMVRYLADVPWNHEHQKTHVACMANSSLNVLVQNACFVPIDWCYKEGNTEMTATTVYLLATMDIEKNTEILPHYNLPLDTPVRYELSDADNNGSDTENDEDDVRQEKKKKTKTAPPLTISSSEDEDEDDNAGRPVPSN